MTPEQQAEILTQLRDEHELLYEQEHLGVDKERIVALSDAIAAMDHSRTLKSIVAMLGWGNMPPRETLEREISTLKALASEAAALRAQGRPSNVVHFPDVPGPDGVCWQQSETLARCTLPKGHELHQWHPARPINANAEAILQRQALVAAFEAGWDARQDRAHESRPAPGVWNPRAEQKAADLAAFTAQEKEHG